MAIYESYTQNTSSEYDPNAPIVLRDEQKKAVAKAKARFKGGTGRKFLWNAKMRFGKTLSALKLAKELDVKRTLIVTHRPVVDANFREDFEKIFRDDMASWSYASRSDNGGTGEISTLEKELKEDPSKHYVFFASMQYLCRSDLVNSKPNADTNPLKHLILNNDWDLVVVDEAHEATTGDTQGAEVVKYLSGKKANVLHLSGTPFNLLDSFSDAEIFTWDYIQEQEKKAELIAKGVPDSENPYITLPKMNIFTYDLAKLNGSKEVGEGAQFTLSEFFRTWSGNPKKDKAKMPEGAKGKFVHEEAVNNFLDLLCSEEGGNNYPFSTEEYQENFKHTFWVVPGVAEAKALTDLLRNHDVFKDVFQIINVAGEGDEDEQRSNALDAVNNAIGDAPDQTATITISCGRLTTGVTVKPWTAVFYLKGSDNTSAATYMQTIFRVQSADVRNGKMKSECYVFDFAPDRSLRAVAETAKFYNLSAKERAVASQASESSDLKKLKQFLSFCPVISLDGGQMVAFDEHKLFTRLNSVYIDRIIRSGYTDNALFNKDAIMRMDPDALKVLDKLDPKERINSKGEGDCDPSKNISNNGLNGKGNQSGTSEEDAPDDDPGDGSQSNAGLSQAEKDERKRKREELEKRRAKLRDITIRIPLLIFGGKFNDEEDITLDNFTRKVDDPSWFEFMPKNIGKDDFNKLKKGINASMFVEAGKGIRKMTREADKMHVEERIAAIAKIHDWFNNPNKETVLTPWRVVNMHLSDCLGGYSFFNETFTGPNQVEIPAAEGDGKLFDFADTIMPRFVSHGEVTAEVFGCDEERPVVPDKGKKAEDVVLGRDGALRPANVMGIKILEINSKTGLYPLYATYSLYRNRLQDYIDAGLIEDAENLSVEEEQVVWDDVLQNNIYVISNTRMAEAITRRTLYGFRDVQYTHIKNEPIVERAKTELDELAKELRSNRFWNGGNVKDTMLKFTAVIGNPPYNEINKGNGNGADPLYHLFIDLGMQIAKKGTLIHPARFLFRAGKTPKDWNDKVLNDSHFKVIGYWADSSQVFPSVDVKGGIATTYWDNASEFTPIGAFSAYKELSSLVSLKKC
ncbi:MAG: Eco57I restriction-modification methylase domain-containing protein [Muribaculum sp.]|nr:Eco57I restriction-modification methylase domain-containing protein [Muribaculum sp.]